jgi:hypothetical protein
VLQLGLHDLIDLVFERRIRGKDSDDGGKELTGCACEHRFSEALFGAEVVVQ